MQRLLDVSICSIAYAGNVACPCTDDTADMCTLAMAIFTHSLTEIALSSAYTWSYQRLPIAVPVILCKGWQSGFNIRLVLPCVPEFACTSHSTFRGLRSFIGCKYNYRAR